MIIAHDDPEVWRPVPGFPRYTVSNHGRVRGYKNNILKANGTSAHRYPVVCLVIPSGGQLTVSIHRLVAAAFLGPCPVDKPLVCHIDDNPTHNHVSNLRYDTYWGNMQDWIKNRALTTMPHPPHLTPICAQVLSILVDKCTSGRPPTMSEIGILIGKDSKTIGQHIRTLTKLGYVIRYRGVRGTMPTDLGRQALAEWLCKNNPSQR